ncbi:ROK family transcriptional regulator [Arthrobacter sp. Y81]|uniref:ROK family transcriptional regulator n=1 Tax=Arthrobacter sp. Y81 TaxID=2058897 RepID=UPI000CE46DC0|nr:ROK family transcriptional regulator [Arthrobacter sp. Y81]
MSLEKNADGGAGRPAPGRVEDVRRGNLVRVLASLAQARTDPDPHPTRADLAARTGLTKASVSSLVAELVDAGLVAESGATRDGERGRPGVGLELSTRRGVVGMEINVDYISAGLLDLGGTLRILRTLERGNRGQSPESVMALLAGLVSDVAAEASAAGIVILGGGLAVPGLVDSASGTVASAPNLHWHAVALQLDRLLPDAPFGTVLHNEANCAALGELWYGHGLDFQDYLFVSGEVGVGGGLVIGSELFAGPHGQAGEVGHMVVEPSGPDCSCGGHGCLETFAGQEAIFSEAGIPAGTASVRLARLGEQLASGDMAAITAVARAGHYLGIAAASTARMMNLSAVVLGGHFTQMGPWIAPAVVQSLADYAPGVVSPARVAVSELGQSAALLGAAGSSLRAVLAAPFSLTPAG